MNRALKAVLTVVMGIGLVAFVISCASTGPETKGASTGPETKAPGFLGDYAKNLQPGPKGGAKERWLKPGVDFAKYNKVMLDHVVFYFAPDSENKAIDTSQLDELAKQFDLAFVNALKGGYPIVTEPGPDVLRIQPAITDLKASKPTLGVVTTVTMVSPIGMGVNLLKRGATGTWTGEGATAGEMMILDSTTNEVIAVARDQRTAGFTGRYTKWGSAEEAVKFWGERLKQFMDEAHGKKQ